MGRLLTLDDLQKQFDLTREALANTRQDILSSAPLPENYSRDAYSFSYLRAERIGLNIISDRLEQISFLPMRLDPKVEILGESKDALKRWIRTSPQEQPDSTNFGNDFIHAMTRVAMMYGWQSPEFNATSYRIAELFHDLSCLIGLIYYGVWMAENGIGGVLVSDPHDIERLAREISDLTLSPEVARLLEERKRSNRANGSPTLHVINNPSDPGDGSPPSSA